VDGLTALGPRPGAPALTLVVEGALGRTVVEAVAATEVTLGVAVGLAAAALLRSRTTRTTWLLGAALAGTFAVHLAAGYLANLLEAVAFLGAAVALAAGTRRGAVVAAGSLGAAGLAHPPFLAVSVGILALTAATGWRRDRAQAVRVGAAVLGGGALAGLGLLAQVGGLPALEVDTSRDAFLRRAGLTSDLRAAFVDRFLHRWTRYVQWASVPLAVMGLGADRGFVGRLLRSWAAVTVVGVVAGLVTGWFPADRFVTYGFAIPILAAFGLVWLVHRLAERRALALGAAAALTVAMFAGAAIAWNRQEPFLSVEEVENATMANGFARTLDVGTPLVFLVNEPNESISFLATRAGNVLRAAVPPDRIRDVVVVVPPLDGEVPQERRALERLTAADREDAERTSGRPAAVFVLPRFDVDAIDDRQEVEGRNVFSPLQLRLSPPPVDPLEPSSPGAIALSSLLAFLLLWVAGFGWARVAVADRWSAASLAPALGAAALVVMGVAIDRVGMSLGRDGPAWLVSALAGGGGYLVWGVLQRRARPRPSPQVEQ
jgi:hypothetical protein